MWPGSSPNRHRFHALVLFGMAILTVAAVAEPLVPAKVRTLTIRSPSAEDPADAPATFEKPQTLQILPVRPNSPDENLDPSRRQTKPLRDSGNADVHIVRTTRIRLEPDATGATGQHFIRSIPVQSPVAPQ